MSSKLTGLFGVTPMPTGEPLCLEALLKLSMELDELAEKPWRKLFKSQGADFDKHQLVLPNEARRTLNVPPHLVGKQIRFGPTHDKPFFVVRTLLAPLNFGEPQA